MHLTPKEVAARLRMTPDALAHWRIKGTGPRYIKLGTRVLYPLAEVEAFERGQLRSSTSQKPA